MILSNWIRQKRLCGQSFAFSIVIVVRWDSMVSWWWWGRWRPCRDMDEVVKRRHFVTWTWVLELLKLEKIKSLVRSWSLMYDGTECRCLDTQPHAGSSMSGEAWLESFTDSQRLGTCQCAHVRSSTRDLLETMILKHCFTFVFCASTLSQVLSLVCSWIPSSGFAYRSTRIQIRSILGWNRSYACNTKTGCSLSKVTKREAYTYIGGERVIT